MGSYRLGEARGVVNQGEGNQRKKGGSHEGSSRKKAVLELWLMGRQPTSGIRGGMLEVEVRRAETVMEVGHECFVIGGQFR